MWPRNLLSCRFIPGNLVVLFAAIGLVCVWSLSACSASAPQSTPPTATNTASDSPVSSPTSTSTEDKDGAATEFSLADKTQQPQVASSLLVTKITGQAATPSRAGHLVVEFQGDGTPGWYSHFTNAPKSMGRGNPINITGKVALDINISGTRWPSEPGDLDHYFKSPQAIAAGRAITAFWDGSFEEDSHLVLSLEKKTPYRIYTLTNPTRLIIEVTN